MKNNTLITKAMSEADTVRKGVFKSTYDVLLEQFTPSVKQIYKDLLKEQTLSLREPQADFDQDEADADVPNPQDDINQDGAGPEILEGDEFDDEEKEETLEDGFEPDADDEDECKEETNELELDDAEGEEELEDLGEEFDFEDSNEEDLNLDADDEDECSTCEDEEIDDEKIEEPVEEADDEEFQFEDIDSDELEDDKLTEDDDEDDDFQAGDPVVSTSGSKTAKNEIYRLKKENSLLKEQVQTLSRKFNQVNLLSTKMAAAHKIVTNPKAASLNYNQKSKILESIDKCRNAREVRLVYNNFANFLNTVSESRNPKNIFRKRGPVATKRNGQKLNESDAKTLRLAGIID